MASAPYITKGDKVEVEFLSSKIVALTGAMMKTGAEKVHVIGTLVHFRGDHPTNPTEIRMYIDVTEGTVPESVKLVKPHGCTHHKGHLEIRESWIRGIEKDGKTYKVR